MAINKLAPAKSKTELTKELGISRASLYYNPKLPAKDLKLKALIEMAMKDNKAYGHKRIATHLHINKKRALRVMNLFHLRPQKSRKKPDKPKDFGQESMTIPNLIIGTIIDAQNKIWVCDFTYLPYFGKFLYLATIEDLFTRQVLGWAISTKHNTALVTEALLKSLANNPAPWIIHSDQGSEYRSQEHLDLLKEYKIQPSMSDKASPWQNGTQESFYSNFKLELGYPEIYPTIGELIEAIACQLHYYNYSRIHTALKCPPAVFAKRCEEKKLIINTQETVMRQSV